MNYVPKLSKIKIISLYFELNKENLKSEFYIPTVANEILISDKARVEELKCNTKWFGVTYKENKDIVQKTIKNFKFKNIYPTNLW